MIGIVLTLAIVAAMIALAVRRWQRLSGERRRPGATIYNSVAVLRFDEIDEALCGRVCGCGGVSVAAGETSRSIGDRRFRVARLVCDQCGREEFVYFDVTRALQ
jgi:hypothetical protein